MAAAEAAKAIDISGVERVLYAMVSVLSFGKLLSLLMVMEHVGAFILILIRVLRRDLPVFLLIYGIFLLCFAQAQISSNARTRVLTHMQIGTHTRKYVRKNTCARETEGV